MFAIKNLSNLLTSYSHDSHGLPHETDSDETVNNSETEDTHWPILAGKESKDNEVHMKTTKVLSFGSENEDDHSTAAESEYSSSNISQSTTNSGFAKDPSESPTKNHLSFSHSETESPLNDGDEIPGEDEEDDEAMVNEAKEFAKLEAEEEDFLAKAVGEMRSIVLDNARLIAKTEAVEAANTDIDANAPKVEAEEADRSKPAEATEEKNTGSYLPTRTKHEACLAEDTQEEKAIDDNEEEADLSMRTAIEDKMLSLGEDNATKKLGVDIDVTSDKNIITRSDSIAKEEVVTKEEDKEDDSKPKPEAVTTPEEAEPLDSHLEETIPSKTDTNIESRKLSKTTKDEMYLAEEEATNSREETSKITKGTVSEATTKSGTYGKVETDSRSQTGGEAVARTEVQPEAQAKASAGADTETKSDREIKTESDEEDRATVKITLAPNTKIDHSADKRFEVERKAVEDIDKKIELNVVDGLELESAQDVVVPSKTKGDEQFDLGAGANMELQRAESRVQTEALSNTLLGSGDHKKGDKRVEMHGEVQPEEMTYAGDRVDREEKASEMDTYPVKSNLVEEKIIDASSDEGDETRIVSLAERMKDMFDSASPVEPSKAFGKKTSQEGRKHFGTKGSSTQSSLARDMKKMFDSPSPDEPSMTFGLGNRVINQPHQPTIMDSKICRKSETKQSKRPDRDKVEPNSSKTDVDVNVSASSQMVSLLWASSLQKNEISPSSRNTAADIEIEKGKEDKLVDCYTVVEKEDGEEIEEMTVHEYAESVASCNEDDEDDFIEEVVIDDDNEDGTGITTAVDIFEEMDVDIVEVGRNQLHDETTVDDWEFEEATIDDDETVEEISDKKIEDIDNIATIIITDSNKTNLFNANGSVSQTRVDYTMSLNPSSHSQKDYKKDNSPGRREFALPAPLMATETDCSQRNSLLREQQRPATDTEKENSETRRYMMRLGMSDAINVTPKKYPPSWQNSKNLSESTLGKRCNTKTSPVLQVTNTSAMAIIRPDWKKDEGLVEEIISLVKEPNAMQNKMLLAERITFLLVGDVEEETKSSNTSFSSCCLSPSKTVEYSPTGNKYQSEANAYSNRKKDGFKDPGLKKMRRDVLFQKAKLDHVDDPDTISNRTLRRRRMRYSKANESMHSSVLAAFSFENETRDESSLPSAEDKAALAEKVISRIWPKTPDGANPKSKPWQKGMLLEPPKTPSPKKLGDRLKMFESPSSSCSSPFTNDRCNRGRAERNTKGKADRAPISLFEKTTKPSGNVSGVAETNKVSERTLKNLCAFQRLWRRTRSKPGDVATTDIGASSKKKRVSFLTIPSDRTIRSSGANSEKPKPALREPRGSDALASTSSSGQERNADSAHAATGCSGIRYKLEDFELGRFDKDVVDMDKWEDFLEDDEFSKHFGVSREEFSNQPKWKRDRERRRIRVAF